MLPIAIAILALAVIIQNIIHWITFDHLTKRILALEIQAMEAAAPPSYDDWRKTQP